MRTILIFITTAIAAMMPNTVSAFVIGIDECCLRARNNYPAMAQYGLAEMTEELTIANASSAWLPQVSVGAKATWQSRVTSLPDQLNNILAQMGTNYSGMNPLQYGASVEVSQLIWDGGAISDRKAAARSQAVIAERSTDLTLYEVEGRVQEIYFGILLLQRQLVQIRLTETLLDSTLCRVQSMVANGVMLPSAAYEVEAQLLSSRQNRASIESMMDAYKRSLALFTGLEASQIELTEPSTLSSTSNDQGPQEALYAARESGLEVQARAVKSSLMPKIGAFATASYGYPGMDMFRSMRSGRPDTGFIAGINLRWDISAFYTRSNRLKQIANERRVIDIERDITEFNRRLTSESINGEIKAVKTALSDDEKIAELRTKVRMAAESQLTNGIISPTDLLEKITAEENARLNLNVNTIKLMSQYYKLNHTLNR